MTQNAAALSLLATDSHVDSQKSSLPISAGVRVPQTILSRFQSCCPCSSCFPIPPLLWEHHAGEQGRV